MILMQDFEKDGKTDWAAYKAARIAAGEVCPKCSTGILPAFGKAPPGPRLCYDCKALEDDPDEVGSDNFIRCPKCKHQELVSDFDSGCLYEDGEHDVCCEECGHEYTVTTSVSYTFDSPALLKETGRGT